MASPESVRIRATFAHDPTAPAKSLAVMREEWQTAAAQAELPPTATVTPVDVLGINGEWVSNSDADSDQVLLFLHGGGYNAGSCVTHRELAARLCLASNVRVLLIDYRLAPEHPFPAAVEDGATSYQWLLASGFKPDQIVVGGDSAGGGLAIASLLWLRDHAVQLPAAGVLLSPWVDLAISGPSAQRLAAIDPLTTLPDLQRAAAWYIGDAALAHPLASPLYAELHGLPPLLIQVGTDEILLDDATRLAEKATAEGVAVTLDVWDNMWHVWQSWAAVLPEAQQAIDRIGAFIQKQLSHP